LSKPARRVTRLGIAAGDGWNCEGEDGAVISTDQTEPQSSSLLRKALLVPLWAAVVIGVVILIAALPGRASKWDYSIYYSSALAMRVMRTP
jgi:hypothetical protein